ncbi:phenylalanine 4-monooxygenase, partial [Vibrio alfacsensis]
LDLLDLPLDRVPQLPEINRVLHRETGWQVEPVPALIDFDRFFALLADRKFPVATFLRSREEFDYLQEPDFFHEVFG